MVREVFERGHAVGVLLYDPRSDRVGLIEQFRAPVMTAPGFDPWLIEVVAGVIDAGESPDEVAVRECAEEAGIAVSKDRLIPIARFLTTPGGSSETVSLFCAEIDASSLSGIHGLAEEHEDIRLFTVPADEAIAWVEQGRIVNAIAIIALQWLALRRARPRP